MEQKKQEVLEQVRNFFLGTGNSESPDFELVEEFYENDSEFREAFDKDDVLYKSSRVVRDCKEDSLELFRTFRSFCLGKDVYISHWYIKAFYQGNLYFREACDNDPLVRAVIMDWLKENENV